jgi:hypothetical protein
MPENYEEKYIELKEEYTWLWETYCKLRARLEYGGKN